VYWKWRQRSLSKQVWRQQVSLSWWLQTQCRRQDMLRFGRVLYDHFVLTKYALLFLYITYRSVSLYNYWLYYENVSWDSIFFSPFVCQQLKFNTNKFTNIWNFRHWWVQSFEWTVQSDVCEHSRQLSLWLSGWLCHRRRSQILQR